jgi:hypothetical protein
MSGPNLAAIVRSKRANDNMPFASRFCVKCNTDRPQLGGRYKGGMFICAQHPPKKAEAAA